VRLRSIASTRAPAKRCAVSIVCLAGAAACDQNIEAAWRRGCPEWRRWKLAAQVPIDRHRLADGRRGEPARVGHVLVLALNLARDFILDCGEARGSRLGFSCSCRGSTTCCTISVSAAGGKERLQQQIGLTRASEAACGLLRRRAEALIRVRRRPEGRRQVRLSGCAPARIPDRSGRTRIR